MVSIPTELKSPFLMNTTAYVSLVTMMKNRPGYVKTPGVLCGVIRVTAGYNMAHVVSIIMPGLLPELPINILLK